MSRDIERWFYKEIRDMRKALPRPTTGKVRPKNVRMPSEMIDRRTHPDYKAGPVIRYHLSELQGQAREEEKVMRVRWFTKQDARSADQLTVTVNKKWVYLSTSLRNKLADDGSPISVLLGEVGGRLALVRSQDSNGWRVGGNGRITDRRLPQLLAKNGFPEGRYVMQWDEKLECYVSTRRDEPRTRKRAS